ncbi:tumor necrosis factor alpha-induced protein 2a [Diretmus argenteus]
MEKPETSRGAVRSHLRLKIPALIRRNRRAPDRAVLEEPEEVLILQEKVKQELLEETSRQLISREEELFVQEAPSEEEEDKLQKDLEALLVQVWMAIHSSFSASSSEDLEVLRSAVASIQQQEAQDRRWEQCPEDRIPIWRPQKCLSTHITLLCNTVESRLKSAALDGPSDADYLSSSLKREVCRMGKCLKEDLLTVVRKVKNCYPPEFDILNLYAGLYQQTFAARLTELAGSDLDVDDCSYLLFWVNDYYPNDVLKHKELEGKIKTACLGALLLQEDLNRLEEQYLSHKAGNVKLWLQTALKREEESWMSGTTPEVIDQYYFSPLAVDIIQVWYNQIWTELWLDGSVLVLDQLLDSLDQQLSQFTDLKPACREALLARLHQEVLLQYVKRMMKMKVRMKSSKQQVGGATKMIEDGHKINDFFTEGGSRQAWLAPLLSSIAEVLRLQDPGSLHLEIVSLARQYHDLSDVHVSMLLSLKTGLSAADVRSIRKSVEENRLSDASTNHSPAFFVKVKVKWINKINKFAMKP